MLYELGILGSGNMAEAIARGVLSRQLFTPDQLIAADPIQARRDLFSRELQVKTTTDNAEVARQSKVLLLSTKPYQINDALAPLGAAMSDATLIISIAAGITSQTIARALGPGKNWRIIRTMPNTPMLVGEGIVGVARGQGATAQDLAAARRIFESAAEVVEVTEDQIDAVTALSGSGPAYFYYLVEAMIRAGIEMGLSPETSKRLAIKTAVGSGKLLSTSTDSPQELRKKVTTPGGTTHAAISHMESKAFDQIVVDALKQAQKRGKELGESSH